MIAFTGMPGSGKSVAVEAVRARGIPVVRMGHFVLEEVTRRGLPHEEAHIGPVASGMRADHGDDIWAVRTIQALRAGHVEGVTPDTRLVAVDGVRSLAEVERFRRDLGKEFHLVAVTAPAGERHERILGRGRVDDAAERAHILQRDERERGWGLEEAMQKADHTLHNDTDLDTFRARVDTLLARLLDA